MRAEVLVEEEEEGAVTRVRISRMGFFLVVVEEGEVWSMSMGVGEVRAGRGSVGVRWGWGWEGAYS